MDGGIYYSNKDSMMEMSRIFVTRSMSLGTFITYASKSSVSVEWWCYEKKRINYYFKL